MELSKTRQQRLKLLVDSVGLAEFSERVGRSKTQISGLTTGWRNMGEKLAREFERKLGLEDGYFDQITDDKDGNLVKTVLDKVRVPLIAWESLLGEDSGQPIEVIMAGNNIPTSAQALEVRDKSMLPTFAIGDQIIYVPDKAPRPSDFVVAVADGEPVMRKYRVISKDVFELVPLNSDYPTLSSNTSAIELCGVVVQLRKNFD